VGGTGSESCPSAGFGIRGGYLASSIRPVHFVGYLSTRYEL
jgi:hypothetical protein